jgi:hypothetical protein
LAIVSAAENHLPLEHPQVYSSRFSKVDLKACHNAHHDRSNPSNFSMWFNRKCEMPWPSKEKVDRRTTITTTSLLSTIIHSALQQKMQQR